MSLEAPIILLRPGLDGQSKGLSHSAVPAQSLAMNSGGKTSTPTSLASPSASSSQLSTAETHEPLLSSSISSPDGSDGPVLGDDTMLALSPSVPPTESNLNSGDGASEEMDSQILEALRSKDRLFVLKLGEIMENLITQRLPRIDVSTASSYQRLLVHRCADYYKCIPQHDGQTKILYIALSEDSRIPSRKISELVPVETVVQPKFSIMKRNGVRGRGGSSTAGSVAGGDDGAELSDVEPSEAGSLYSRGSGAQKKRLTMEEREAAYQQARSRIFMDFTDKEKERSSTGSSSVSAGSASTSTGTGPGSSIDDFETESVTTESEWSAPASRDSKRNSTVADTSSSTTTPSRNSRSRKPRSTRASRGTSPSSSSSFTYASIYEPTGEPYEAYPAGQGDPGRGYNVYPHQAPTAYRPPGPGEYGQVYAHPYPYYNPYYPPPGSMGPVADHSLPPMDPYGHPQPQHSQYMAPQPPYVWTPPQGEYSQPMQPAHSPPAGPMPPPMHPYTASAPYGPPPPSGYGVPPGWNPYGGYYTTSPPPVPPQTRGPAPTHMTPGQVPMHPPQMTGTPPYPPELARQYSTGSGTCSTPSSGGHSRTSSRNSSQGRHNGPAWGPPGSLMHGHGHGHGMGHGHGHDVVGPRLSAAPRRLSTTSSAGSSGARTPGDEASSTASGSTSSSSVRTFTSTSTSSKHPLPARPDWAIGLSPARHHRDGSDPRARTPSSVNPGTGHSLQPTDFPPLPPPSGTTGNHAGAPAPTPRIPPVAAGAWGNSNSTRQILTASPVIPASGTGAGAAKAALEDRTFERPPPKNNPELFNPKQRKAVGLASTAHGQKNGVETSVDAGLSEGMMSLRLEAGSNKDV